MVLCILGTDYEIEKRKYKDDPYFERWKVDGYCDGALHKIVYCDMSTFPGNAEESADFNLACEKKLFVMKSPTLFSTKAV